MDSFEDTCCWDFLDCSLIGEDDSNPSLGFSWPDDGGAENDISVLGIESEERDCTRKRMRNESSSRTFSKACREKLRRDKLNDRFLDLSSTLEPGRPAKTNKPAVLDDAIRVLNQLRNETQELKETNEKLQEEVKSLKAEKNELREEKSTLKAGKERIEQHLKAMAMPPTRIMQTHPVAFHAAVNKMAVFPSYGMMPMWQYLPPSVCDTSDDHELRPPAA